MQALRRNPLVRFGAMFWWAPLLAVVGVAFWAGGGNGLLSATCGFALLLGAAMGVLGAAAVHGKRRLSAAEGEAFLCSGCLHAGRLRRACPHCKHGLEPFLTATAGAYVDRCGNCNERLSLAEGETPLPAYCEACGNTEDGAKWGNRRVRAVGV